MGWLPVWGPSIAAVIVAAAFTWLFGYVTERKRQRGVRELVKLEVRYNEAAVEVFKGHVAQIQDASVPTKAFGLMKGAPEWQRTRWDLPDVGAAFSPGELVRLSTWYYALDRLGGQYQWLISIVQKYEASGEDAERVAEVITVALDGISSMVETALKTRPRLT